MTEPISNYVLITKLIRLIEVIIKLSAGRYLENIRYNQQFQDAKAVFNLYGNISQCLQENPSTTA